MKLNSRQLNQLHQALLHSFDRDGLRMMVRLQLDENLEAITGDDDLATVLFDLITWAERTNRVGDLVSGALASNPNNPELQQLAAGYARWQAQSPVGAATGAPIAPSSAASSAAPATLPVERTRGTNWLLPTGVALVLVLLAAWLLRPYLLPTGSVEPTPAELTPAEPTRVEPTGVEMTVEPALTPEPPATEATSVVENGDADTTPSLEPKTPLALSSLMPRRTLVINPNIFGTIVMTPTRTPQPPRAPALKVDTGLTVFNEESRLLTIKSGQSLNLDMRQLWSAPEGTPVDCAGGLIVASWQVRQPYPGGEELEIRRSVPRAGGQTELLASGARGNVTLGYCDELILQNLGLDDYRLEWRYVSAIAKS